jgi:hypothetical protein
LPAAIAARFREQFSPEERKALIAALLAEAAPEMPADPLMPAAPPIEQISISTGEFALNNDPEQTGKLDCPPPSAPPEARDNPEERARLMAILFKNPSGVPGYMLLDVYKIPPETIELARRHGQAGHAERGIGLTTEYGGAWAKDVDNLDVAASLRAIQRFREATGTNA